MLLIVATLIGIALAVVLVMASTKPDTFHVERSTTIKAPPAKIFPLIDDFHRWSSWSPWDRMDPAMNRKHSGAPAGRGAVYEWQGNKKVGEGRMEIVDSVPSSRVVIKLDFVKPFEGHNVTEFKLAPDGGSTRVTWEMHGPAPFVSKLMQVFMSMDKMVGKDFERGLENMKAAAEGT